MNKDTYRKLKIFNFSEIIKKIFKKSNLKTLILGNFGVNNMGDEAILAGQIKELKKIKSIQIVVSSKNPQKVKKLHNVDSISVYNIFEVFRNILNSDFIIFGGGGLICKSDKSIIGIAYQAYLLLISLFTPLLFRKKIFILGFGIYNNSNIFIQKIAYSLLKKVEVISVRDQHSFDLLKNNHIKSLLHKDNSYLIDLYPKNKVLNLSYFKTKYNKKYKNIAFALTKPEKIEDQKKVLSYIQSTIIKNKNANFWFYACDAQKGEFNDMDFIGTVVNRIKKAVKNKSRLNIIPERLSPIEFFSSFKLMDEIVAMRFHAILFSYRTGAKFTAIPYDIKCTSFLNSIGKKSSITLGGSEITRKKVYINNLRQRLFILLRRSIYTILGYTDYFLFNNPKQVCVVVFHSVMNDEWRFSIDTKVIKEQLKYLQNNFEIISLSDLEQIIKGKKIAIRPSVAITFDDGYKDILKLKKTFQTFKTKPTIFVLSDTHHANKKELGTNRPFLSQKDIKTLIDNGWEIGSHTMTHSNLIELTESELSKEIISSKKILEQEYKIPIKYIAYPRGKYNNMVLNIVKKAGYKMAFTMDDSETSRKTNPLMIPRIGVDRTHSFSEFKMLFSKSNINMRMFVKKSFIGRYI